MFETDPMMDQAPGAPPIPPMPSRPGATTGGQGAATTAAPAAGSQAAQTEAQAAQAEAQAARAEAEAARSTASEIRRGIQEGWQDGRTSIEIPPPYRSNDNEIPREVIPILGIVGGTIITIVVLGPIARAFARMVNRRADAMTARVPDSSPQLRQIQESLDVMAVELERISEAQRFQAKLMAERPAALPVERGSAAP